MKKGWFVIDREIFDHPVIGGDPVRFRAWCWMISAAAIKPHRVDLGGRTIWIDRGQFCHSTRFMADKMGMSETSVRRFLTRLKTDAMIGAESGAGQTIVTICNYRKYQDVPDEGGAACGAESGAAAAQQRRKEEQGKQDKKKEGGGSRARAREGDPPEDIDPAPKPTTPAMAETPSGPPGVPTSQTGQPRPDAKDGETIAAKQPPTAARPPMAKDPIRDRITDLLPRILEAAGIDLSKDVTGKWLGSEQRHQIARWIPLDLTDTEMIEVAGEVAKALWHRKRERVSTLRYFDRPMQRRAAQKAEAPLSPGDTNGHRPEKPTAADRAHRRGSRDDAYAGLLAGNLAGNPGLPPAAAIGPPADPAPGHSDGPGAGGHVPLRPGTG